MPTAAASTATQTTATANVGASASRAATASASGLEGLFAQMIAAMEAAAAKAAATAGLVTPTNAPTTTQATDTATTDAKTTDDTTANSDLAGALAVMVQGGTLAMAPAGLASPASLGARGAVASATSAQKPGIDGGPMATAAPGPTGGTTAATAGIAATDAATTAATPTTTADTAATSTSAATAATADATTAKDATAADPLGLQALVAKSTSTTPETAAAGPRLYDRPTPRAADTAARAVDEKSLAETDGSASTRSRFGLDPTTDAPARPAVDVPPKDVEAVAAKASGLTDDKTPDARKDDLPTTGDPQPTLVGAPARHDGVERVTERAAAATVSHAVALSAVAETIATHTHAGTSRFAIKLDPAELGSIDVRVEVKSTGEVRAHLVVERADTLDMMLRDQKSLERSLAQSGLDVGSSGLQFSLKDQGSGNGSTARDDLPRAAAIETDEPTPVTLDLAAQAYRPRRPGGLDLRI